MGIPVLTFTAYSNTGKTTYLEKLIPCLKSAGLRIAVIKHDAHDFQADIEGKDSWRFAQAGADIVAVASKRQFALFQYSSFDLSAIITQIHNVDLCGDCGQINPTNAQIPVTQSSLMVFPSNSAYRQ